VERQMNLGRNDRGWLSFQKCDS